MGTSVVLSQPTPTETTGTHIVPSISPVLLFFVSDKQLTVLIDFSALGFFRFCKCFLAPTLITLSGCRENCWKFGLNLNFLVLYYFTFAIPCSSLGFHFYTFPPRHSQQYAWIFFFTFFFCLGSFASTIEIRTMTMWVLCGKNDCCIHACL